MLGWQLELQSLDEFVGDKDSAIQFSDWLQNFKNKCPGTAKALLLTGSEGVGKTTLANLMLKSSGFTPIKFNASDVRSQKTIRDMFGKLTRTGNVAVALHQKMDEVRDLAIIMDDIESLNMTDKGGLTELIHFINPFRGKRSVKKSDKEKQANKWSIPIICICTDPQDKKGIELQKDCQHIHLIGTDSAERERYVRKRCNDCRSPISSENVKLISALCGTDMRKLSNILFEVNLGTPIDSILPHYSVVDGRESLFEMTRKTFCDTNLDLNTSLKLFDSDKLLLPLMIHENYPVALDKFGLTGSEFMNYACMISSALCKADEIDRLTYTSQNWNIANHIGAMAIFAVNHLLSRSNKERSLSQGHIKFTSNLTKTSFQYANTKTIENLVQKPNRPGFAWDDLLTLGKMIDRLMAIDVKSATMILADYSLDWEDLRKIKKANRVGMDATPCINLD